MIFTCVGDHKGYLCQIPCIGRLDWLPIWLTCSVQSTNFNVETVGFIGHQAGLAAHFCRQFGLPLGHPMVLDLPLGRSIRTRLMAPAILNGHASDAPGHANRPLSTLKRWVLSVLKAVMLTMLDLYQGDFSGLRSARSNGWEVVSGVLVALE